MKQAVLIDKKFIICEVADVKCASDQVVVKMLANGICSSDIGIFKNAGERKGKEIFLGHEGSGTIIEAGSKITNFKIGDKVTVLGGVFAEYFVATPHTLVRLPDSIDPRWALGEPIACCVHAMNRSKIKQGDRIAILGCGFMGLVCLQLAKIMGARQILAVGSTNEDRLTLAKQLGATETSLASDLSAEKFRQKYGDFQGDYDSDMFQGDYDVVIEAAGNQAAIDTAGYLVKQHGLINLVGHHFSNNGMRTVFINQWNVKAIDVINGHVRHEDEKKDAMQQGIELIHKGLLAIEPLVAYYPLSQVQQAFEDVVNSKKGLIKAILIPD
jgi:threonine dehydrogenase-like Zn-dependent dehydrogenase